MKERGHGIMLICAAAPRVFVIWFSCDCDTALLIENLQLAALLVRSAMVVTCHNDYYAICVWHASHHERCCLLLRLARKVRRVT